MITRREFIRVSTTAGGALVLGIAFGGCSTAKRQQRRMEDLAGQTGEFRPNAWITVTPDDRVLVAVEKSEMGQGVLSSHAMLVAEELEVSLDRVEASSADGAKEYQSSFGMQQTGGSTSLKESFLPIRSAAACAREMLVGAAAARWGVAASECEAVDGSVRHRGTGKTLKYGELTVDAAKQPVVEEPRLKKPSEFRVIGSGSTRVDALPKVTGEAIFGIDVQVAGMVKAYILRPPVMGASPESFDGTEAVEQPGVLEVLAFERGVAVIAEKYWQARRAAPLVEVKWSDAELSSVSSEDLRARALEAADGKGTAFHHEGRVDRALRREDVTRVEAVYEAPFLAHATMEPMNCTAWVRDDVVEVWAPTQSPTIVQEVAAHICGVSRDDVICHVTYLGGGFGRRGAPDFAAEAVELSRRTGKPVQVIWSREDDMKGGYYRPFAYNRMEGALDKSGKPVAWRYHSVSQPLSTDFTNWIVAVFPDWMPVMARRVFSKSAGGLFRSGTIPEIISTEGAREIPYAIHNQSIEYTPLQTTIPCCFWRSVGHSYNGFVVESFADELAHAAEEDPFEFRRKNMKDERLLAVMERAAELGDWGASTEAGYGRGIAAHKSFGTYVAEVIEAGVVDGKIDVRSVACVVDCGTVVNPDIVKQNMEGGIIFGLSAALYQKITLEDGVVQQGNYDDFRLLRMFESPEITVEIVDSSHSPSGVGEPAVPPAAPALANAIFAGTGIRLRKMPFVDALDEHFETGKAT
jgi:CO/xanthine dehydrogenase Mo-binding subunit